MIFRVGGLVLSLLLLGNLSGCAGILFGGVAASASVGHDRRTTGTIVEDQSIELKINEQLNKQQEFRDHSHVDVTSYNLMVLLSGEVPSAELRDKAEEIARNTEKVSAVHNELVIGPPSSLADRSNDAWITTKVKSALFQVRGLPDFDATRVKVVTDRGVVYLFGLLRAPEAEAVVETARNVGGVQKVVTLFEYISEPPPPATAT